MARTALTSGFRGPPAAATTYILQRLAGAAPSGVFAVVTYHRVDEPDAKPWLFPPLLSATPRSFETQIAALRKHWQPIALTELLAAQRGKRALPRRAVLVTFDDAYRDFQENAWPLLKRLGVPVTLFVPTAYPDAPERSFWWDRVWHAITQYRGSSTVETPTGLISLRDDDERRQAALSLVELLKHMAHDQAMSTVDALCDRLVATPATSSVLGWDDLRGLHAEGVELAAHSRTHPILTRIRSSDLVAELEGSRRDLESQVPGAFGAVFAYPSGCYNDEVTNALGKHGFQLAFTTERGVNRLGRTDPLRLQRINVGTRSHPELIRAQIAAGALRWRV